jgi:hypothetical protein
MFQAKRDIDLKNSYVIFADGRWANNSNNDDNNLRIKYSM